MAVQTKLNILQRKTTYHTYTITKHSQGFVYRKKKLGKQTETRKLDQWSRKKKKKTIETDPEMTELLELAV